MSGRIRVELPGLVRSPGGARTFELEAPGGLSAGELLGRIGFTPSEAALLVAVCRGTRLRMKDQVPPGSVVEIVLPAGGG